VYPSFSRLLTGTLYAAICLLGATAIFYPRSCENRLMLQNPSHYENKSNGLQQTKIHFLGHHPDCQFFSGNRIVIRKLTFCAACTGLLIGAVTAIVGTIFYFFMGALLFPVSISLCYISYSAILIGLFQFKLEGFVKLTANTLFVFGSFILLMAADLLGSSLLINFYVLGLIVFVLYTRILISDWNNKRICAKCSGCLLRG